MSDDTRPTHEAISEAFAPARELISRLPTEGMDGYAGRRAANHLDIVEKYVRDHREQLRPAPAEPAEA